MKNILILGSLPKTEDDNKLYEVITSAAEAYATKISSPIDTVNFDGSDEERYKRAFEKVKDAGLIIGEMSKPSTGHGMEIRDAAIQNKPIIIIAKEGSNISGLVKGCPAVKEIILYNNFSDLKEKLEAIIPEIK